MKCSFVLIGLFALGIMLASVSAQGGLVSFEASPYIAGNSIDGVDGWSLLGDVVGDVAEVTPIPSGESRALVGSQSVALYAGSGDGRIIPSRPFTDTVFSDGSKLTWDFLGDATAGTAEFYISHDIANGTTPGGVTANFSTGQFSAFGYNPPAASSGFVANHHYLMEMVLDFTADNFEAFYTDITAGGARTSLGTTGFVSYGAHLDLDAASVSANGGVLIVGRNITGGNAALIYDDISSPIPEPCTIVLMTMGLIGLLAYAWRKRK